MSHSNSNQLGPVKQALFCAKRVIHFNEKESSAKTESSKSAARRESPEKQQRPSFLPIDADIYEESQDPSKNLEAYLKELEKKFKNNPEALQQMKQDLAEAEKTGLANLKGTSDPLKMGRLFLEKDPQKNTPEFTVNFQKDSKRFRDFDRNVGAAQLLPDDVTEIAVTDSSGKTRVGTRKVIDGKAGYYDQQGKYIEVHHGYSIAVRKTSQPEQLKPQSEKEEPGVTVKEIPGKDDRRVNMQFEGIGQVYVSVPENLDDYKEKPQYVVFYHGNRGQEGNKFSVDEQIRALRAKGIPAILVYMRDDSKKGRGWGNYDQPKAFTNVMRAVERQTGVSIDHNLRLAGFSGGGYGVGKALIETKDTPLNDDIIDVTYLDATYGDENRGAAVQFAANPEKKVNIIYTPHLAAATKEVDERIRQSRKAEGDASLPGVNIQRFRGTHNQALGELGRLLSQNS